MVRGRPARQISPDELVVERTIARRLGLDPDDPQTAARLQQHRFTRADLRELARRRVMFWSIDAYCFYVDRLTRPALKRGEVRELLQIEIPEEIEGLPVARRQLQDAVHVAEWAYRHRILREDFEAIAQAFIPQPRARDRQEAIDAPWRAAMLRTDPDEQVYQLARRPLTAPIPADLDPPVPAATIARAVERDLLIWEVAEREHPLPSRGEFLR